MMDISSAVGHICYTGDVFAAVPPGYRHALYAGRLHGQGPEVHGQSSDADREAKK